MKLTEYIKRKTGSIKQEIAALYLAYRHPDTPWYAKILLALIIGYALSPVDLVPDFVPVLGYIDDIIILPALIVLARRSIPETVMAECRERVLREPLDIKSKWVAAAVIIIIWLLVVYLVFGLIKRMAD